MQAIIELAYFRPHESQAEFRRKFSLRRWSQPLTISADVKAEYAPPESGTIHVRRFDRWQPLAVIPKHERKATELPWEDLGRLVVTIDNRGGISERFGYWLRRRFSSPF